MAAKHGATKGPRKTRPYASFPREYKSWLTMRRRCADPQGIWWKHYGGRGISVCETWRDDYLSFLKDMGPCPDGHTLDRINPDGNYTPDNCRWASASTQCRNTRAAIKVVFGGEILPLADACELAGVNRDSERQIKHRYGLTHQEAFDRLRMAPKRVRR